jgi:6-phosphogluconolactonase (cycloisomerase 2 family)
MAESGIYVYVSHQGSRQISVLRMSPATGELSRFRTWRSTARRCRWL